MFWNKNKNKKKVVAAGCKECQERKYITDNILIHAENVLKKEKGYKKARNILSRLLWKKGRIDYFDLETAMLDIDYGGTDFSSDTMLLNSYGLIAILENNEVLLTPLGKELLSRL